MLKSKLQLLIVVAIMVVPSVVHASSMSSVFSGIFNSIGVVDESVGTAQSVQQLKGQHSMVQQAPSSPPALPPVVPQNQTDTTKPSNTNNVSQSVGN